jgi:hypothetical protein
MNKTIPTKSALAIIFLLALIVSTYSMVRATSIDQEVSWAMPKSSMPQTLKKAQADCKDRAFEGTAEINVWPVIKDEKTILEIPVSDMPQLPSSDIKNFRLIDTTPALEKKIAASSEKKPVKIKISGFAILCNGMTLASLDYKEGIFRPYMLN